MNIKYLIVIYKLYSLVYDNIGEITALIENSYLKTYQPPQFPAKTQLASATISNTL